MTPLEKLRRALDQLLEPTRAEIYQHHASRVFCGFANSQNAAVRRCRIGRVRFKHDGSEVRIP